MMCEHLEKSSGRALPQQPKKSSRQKGTKFKTSSNKQQIKSTQRQNFPNNFI